MRSEVIGRIEESDENSFSRPDSSGSSSGKKLISRQELSSGGDDSADQNPFLEEVKCEDDCCDVPEDSE